MASRSDSRSLDLASVLAGFPNKLVREVRALGGTDEHLLRLGSPGSRMLIRSLAQALVDGRYELPPVRENRPKVVVPDFVDVEVDFTLPIQVLGPRTRVDQFDRKLHATRFPALERGIQRCRIHLLTFGEAVDRQEALRRIAALNKRACTPHHLAAIATHHPDLQFGAAFFALGQIYTPDEGDPLVAYISSKRERRTFRTMSALHRFFKSSRFPAVDLAA